ncbi:hypothetical protein [Glaciecola petra]|uniref:Lipoprotein n=1 Tax=Glaciecola petra TaxID=3075602 RepID=A0ABU2ZQI9_9ALTE|nr:hypothetical protein [Aestuariibacter sp. P117]MDT0594882.1 hypothetical protein [Aestuariibacter sp. P117]
MSQKAVFLFFSLLVLFACGGSDSSSTPQTSSSGTPIAQPNMPSGLEPPYGGTVFLNPDIITSQDPSIFQSIMSMGLGNREMFDRRTNSFNNVQNVYLFQAIYDGGYVIEVQVNPEFGSESEAQRQAQFYAESIGRIPSVLFKDLETVWIHAGDELFGGGNYNILIHTKQGERYVANGYLEEVLVHEGSHTSLDADHARSSGWLNAQMTDNHFISTYARDNSGRGCSRNLHSFSGS